MWDGGASSKIAGLGISISQNTLFDQFSEKKIESTVQNSEHIGLSLIVDYGIINLSI